MSLLLKTLKPEHIQPRSSAVIAPGGVPIAGFRASCGINHFLALFILGRVAAEKQKIKILLRVEVMPGSRKTPGPCK